MLSEIDKRKIEQNIAKAIEALKVASLATRFGDCEAVEDCVEKASQHLYAISEIGDNYDRPLYRETCSVQSIYEQYAAQIRDLSRNDVHG